MQNPGDLNQAVQALQREMQKVLDEIKQKETQFKEIEMRDNAINQDIKKDDAEIRQKQQDILRIQQDMDVKKREIAAAEKNASRIKQEIERLKLEQLQKNNAVNNMTRQQKDALNQQNIRR